MSNVNDVTGDKLISKALSKEGKDNWDIIFGKKEDRPVQPEYIPHWVLGCEQQCINYED